MEFKFRLEKILEIKIRNVEEYMIIHSKILNHKIKIENEIKNLEIQYDKYADIQQSETNITKKIIAFNYMNSLFQSIQSYREELEEIKKEFEKSKKKLLALELEKKSLELLKEKKYKEFLEEVELQEDELNDEFSIQTFIRNSN